MIKTKKADRIVFNFAVSIHFNKKLNKIAKIAAEIAPIKIKLELFRSIPNKIKLPNPPAPINAAKVAVPIMNTAAVRIPDIITGIAIAISNFLRRSNFVIPKAIPASTRLSSIPCNPVIVFCKIGNNAYNTNVVKAGNVPIPIKGINNPINAKDGNV